MFNKLEYNRRYHLSHKEEEAAIHHQYYLDHKAERGEYYRQYLATHKEERLASQRQYYIAHTEERKAYNKRYGGEVKLKVLTHYSGGELKCIRCGITDIDVLSVDHINGNGYAQRKVEGQGGHLYRWLKKNNFPSGYQTLCFNCNFKKHIQEAK